MDQIRGTGPIQLPAEPRETFAARVRQSPAQIEPFATVKVDGDADQTQKKTGPLSLSSIDLDKIGKSIKEAAIDVKAIVEQAVEQAEDVVSSQYSDSSRAIRGQQAGGGGDGDMATNTIFSSPPRPPR